MSAIAAIPLCFAEHEGRGITVAVVDSGCVFARSLAISSLVGIAACSVGANISPDVSGDSSTGGADEADRLTAIP